MDRCECLQSIETRGIVAERKLKDSCLWVYPFNWRRGVEIKGFRRMTLYWISYSSHTKTLFQHGGVHRGPSGRSWIERHIKWLYSFYFQASYKQVSVTLFILSLNFKRKIPSHLLRTSVPKLPRVPNDLMHPLMRPEGERCRYLRKPWVVSQTRRLRVSFISILCTSVLVGAFKRGSLDWVPLVSAAPRYTLVVGSNAASEGT